MFHFIGQLEYRKIYDVKFTGENREDIFKKIRRGRCLGRTRIKGNTNMQDAILMPDDKGLMIVVFSNYEFRGNKLVIDRRYLCGFPASLDMLEYFKSTGLAEGLNFNMGQERNNKN